MDLMLRPDLLRLVGAFGSTRRRKQLAVKESAAVRADAVGGAEAVTALLAAAADSAAAGGATRVRPFRWHNPDVAALLGWPSPGSHAVMQCWPRKAAANKGAVRNTI